MRVSSVAQAPISSRQPAIGRMGEFVAERLRVWQGVAAPRFLTVPAPLAPAERLLNLGDHSHGLLWDPPEGPSISGLGAAQLLQVEGPGRFEQLRNLARAAAAGMLVETHPEALEVEPRWLGGMAFDVAAAVAEPWREFGDGCFTLPRFTYTCSGSRAALSLALGRDESLDFSQQAELVAEVGRILAGLAEESATGPATPTGASLSEARASFPLRVEKPSQERWTRRIEAIRAAIEEGNFAKIVAARRSVVDLAAAGDASLILGRLAQGLRASTRFAFCRPGGIFLGATPERLITRRGSEIHTEALAGSIASGSAEQAVELLNSQKDLEEHRLVVEEIVNRLQPLCEQFSVAAAPQIRELRDVLHLRTPIRGYLRHPSHVVDLVRMLHPTPAVGGVPTEEALAWIARHEPASRGWYAGPIGWFDAAGDGEFAVALRSCLLCDQKAYLYAGAGIVADSDPRLEYQETELKKQTLLAALGA